MLLQFDPNSMTALLIVDMQKFFFTEPEMYKNFEEAVENINLASRACTLAGYPVFHITSQFKPDRSDWDLKMLEAGTPELIEGSEETDILAGIEVDSRHYRSTKTRYSGFFETNLADRLKALGVKRVIITGAYTHHCVNATVFDAYCHNFVPGILVDAVISHREAEANLMVERMRRNGYHVMTTAEFVQDCIQSTKEHIENPTEIS